LLNIDRQRWLDRYAGQPLCWLLTLLHRLKGVDPEPPRVRRILVILLSEMGALVLTRPMFERLREKFEGARIFVLCSEQNRQALELLDLVPDEDVLVVRSHSLTHLVADSANAIRRIRAIGIDAVIDAELFSRISAIYSGLSGAPIRVGFYRHTQEGLYRGDFINRPVLYNPYHHIAEQFVSLAEAIDSTTVPKVKRLVSSAPPPPRVALREGELERARRTLVGRFPGIANKRLVFLCPGAGLIPLRAWPVTHYVQTARDLTARGFVVAIIGLPQDRDLAQAIQAGCPDTACVDLTGHTASVRDLTVLLHLGELLITNDGGTAHFAALTPIPVIALYGPETPVLYGSRSNAAVNLYKGLSCSPCLTAYNHRRSPCDGDNVCLKSITPEEVLTSAYVLLGINTHAGAEGTPALPQR
jgi:ADP-heptose:LPS heptosyltransferase